MKKLLAIITAGALIISMAVPAFADNNTGYEGQPGGQSNGGHGGNNGSNSNNPPPGN